MNDFCCSDSPTPTLLWSPAALQGRRGDWPVMKRGTTDGSGGPGLATAGHADSSLRLCSPELRGRKVVAGQVRLGSGTWLPFPWRQEAWSIGNGGNRTSSRGGVWHASR
jgi:hypothetical protein